MGVMLQASLFKLIVISLLAIDFAVQGSVENIISPSPEIPSAIPPIQGAMAPASQENSPISNDSIPKLQNGSTMPPPNASPPVNSSPLAPTIKVLEPSLSPSVSIPLSPPPVISSPPAPTVKDSEPSPSPSVLTPHNGAPPPDERHIVSPPGSASPPQMAPVIASSGVPPALAPISSTPFGNVPQHSPITDPSVPPPLPPIANNKNESGMNAPVQAPRPQAPISSTPFGDVPQHSPVTNPSIPPPLSPITSNKNESGMNAPVQEPRAQVPVASPQNGMSHNSSSASSHPPAKAPSVITDNDRSPASAPPQKRNHMPFASPPSLTLSPLPLVNHSPTKGTSHAVAPSKHFDTAPAPSLPSHHREWSYSPASSPLVSSHRNHNAGKAIPPLANPPSKAPSTKKAVTPSENAPAPHFSSSPSESFSPTSPPSGSVHKHPFSRKPALSPTPGSSHVDISPTSTWQGPIVPPINILPRSMRRHSSPPPWHPGPSISPSHFPVPSPLGNTLPAPTPSPTTKSGHAEASPANASSSSPKIPLLPPFHAFPPPPPNEDCTSTVCKEPLTNTPPGAPCGCVMPMQVGLRLGVDLYTFFPLVSEFASEIASGVFMKQSQVRIMGANAATEQPEKTIVLLDLVPLGDNFDNETAFLTFERFWHKQLAINASSFGDYDVLYVRYSGLPPSPPLPPSEVGIIDDGPYSGNDNNARTNKPLGVDVRGGQHKHSLSGGVIAIIVLSILVAVVLCSVAAWILILKHREHVSQAAPAPQTLLPSVAKSSGIGGSNLGSGPSSASLSFGSSIATYTGSAKTYSASDIERATNNFNSSRIIGEGGFGRVYSGVLDDGTKVAVKVLKRDDQQGGREFLAEVEMLSRLHHRNLVKLMGICTEERARCLVYELIPNGSVESHLHGVDKETAPLDWAARMKIALGAARGLAYLHEDSSPRVIHRDFKSSNILLEQDFTPKVSDFGLARTALDEENRHISTRVMGTFGYVAPEYAMTGHLLVKSDVYSYGVVLLELLTGRKPVDMTQPPGQENLVAWARPLLSSKEGLEMIVDPSLGPDVPFDSVAKVAAIASMCVQPEVSHRPFMGEVVQALKLVCNECDEAKGVGSRSSSRDDLSIDLDGRASSASGPLSNPLHSQYSDPTHASGIDMERGLSVSELLSTSAGYERQVSGSFRRHSSSGPLRTGRGPHFWQRFRRLSGGSVSEHGGFLRLWPGSQ